MRIIKKISAKAKDNMGRDGISIAFLGDSVTQGCFELYKWNTNSMDTVYDKNGAYHNYLAKIFTVLFPSVPINIINAGISGDKATGGVKRVERDIISHNPDLAVICYGLNDCCDEADSVQTYVNALEGIFKKLIENDIEIIFMTPNMMNTNISVHITDDDLFRGIAENTMRYQNEGYFDNHINAAKKLCEKYGIVVCDCYSIWKKMYESGVNCTELLSNKINHPSRDMNKLFAIELARTMFFED